MILRNLSSHSIRRTITSRLFTTGRSEFHPNVSFVSTTNKSDSVLNTQASNDVKEPLKFQGNTEIVGTAEERMTSLFGGRIKGDVRVSSSRTEVGQPRLIAKVLVPDKPKEPDNCCMSGCVNCVWEQYNDDIKDWRSKRKDAIKAIGQTDEIWPADFDPPLKKLEIKNVPKELRSEKRKLARAKKITTASYFPTKGKPGAQNISKEVKKEEEPNDDDEDGWANVPVSFKVFAEAEKKLKQKKLAAAAAKAAKAKSSTGDSISTPINQQALETQAQ